MVIVLLIILASISTTYSLEIETDLERSFNIYDKVDEIESINRFKFTSLYYDDGHYFLLDSRNSKIIKFNQDFRFKDQFGERGGGPNQFGQIYSLTFSDDLIFIYDIKRGEISLYDKGFNYIRKIDLNGLFLQRLTFFDKQLYLVDYSTDFDRNQNIVSLYSLPDSISAIDHSSIKEPIIEYRSELKQIGSGKSTGYLASTFIDIEKDYHKLIYSKPDNSILFYNYRSKKEDSFSYNSIPFRPFLSDKRDLFNKRTYSQSYFQLFLLKDDYIMFNVDKIRGKSNSNTFYIKLFQGDRYIGETTLNFIPKKRVSTNRYQLYSLNRKLILIDSYNGELSIYNYKVIE